VERGSGAEASSGATLPLVVTRSRRGVASACGFRRSGSMIESIAPVGSGLLPMIQLAITPVILIAGVGSLLLSITNRMGRVVDRTRILAGQARAARGEPAEHAHLGRQLTIMYRRAGLVRVAVTLATLSMICSGLLVLVIFASALAGADAGWALVALFALSIGLLLGALTFFLRDIHVSLAALGLEVERARGDA
jgi:hypothetical protein